MFIFFIGLLLKWWNLIETKPVWPWNLLEDFLKSCWSQEKQQKSALGPQNWFWSSEVHIWSSGTSICCPIQRKHVAYHWTSRSISGGSHSLLLDLQIHVWRYQQHLGPPSERSGGARQWNVEPHTSSSWGTVLQNIACLAIKTGSTVWGTPRSKWDIL